MGAGELRAVMRYRRMALSPVRLPPQNASGIIAQPLMMTVRRQLSPPGGDGLVLAAPSSRATRRTKAPPGQQSR